MSSQEPNAGLSNQSSGKQILIRSVIVLMLFVAGGSYTYYLYTRPPLRKILADGETALMKGDVATAEKIGREAKSRAPQAPETLVYLAQVHVANKKYDEALELIRKIPAGTPDNAGARAIQAGLEMTHLGKLVEADRLYKEALSLDPRNEYALGNYSELLQISMRCQERAAIQLRMVELGSISPQLMYALALNWNNHSRSGVVEDLYKKNPDDPNTLLGMADIALTEGQYGVAEKYLRTAASKAPEMVEIQHRLGRILLAKQDYPGLLQWQRGLGQEAEVHPGVWCVRANWAQKQGDVSGAIRCYWESLKHDANQVEANYRLGQLLKLNQKETEGTPFSRRAFYLEIYADQIQQLMLSSKGVPTTEQIMPLFNMAYDLGLYWEAVGWTMVLGQIQKDDKTIETMQEKLVSKTHGKEVQRSYPPSNPALSLDLSSYGLPEWEKISAAQGSGLESGATVGSAKISFEDQAQKVGIDFSYFNDSDPKLHGMGRLLESTGGGVGVIDFDQDGLSDLYFTQGCDFPVNEKDSSRVDRLYRNLGNGKFVDVTDKAGLVENRFSQGVSVGDVNNDGYPDLYVANVGHNRLYLNNGDGTFEDMTSRSGAAGPDVWTTSCAIVDVNGDHLPDIYAVNYLDREGVNTVCRTAESQDRLHLGLPRQFGAEEDVLLMNMGDGRFRNMSKESGILIPEGRGLGIVAARLTGKPGLSLLVTNSGLPSVCLVNQSLAGKPPKFTFQSHQTGLGFDADGKAKSCVGFAVDDIDQNGLLDIYATCEIDLGNALYFQRAAGFYQDQVQESGLHESSLTQYGFGTQSLDADLDSWPDLIQTNGHIDHYPDVPFGYEMPPQFFRNVGQGKFREMTATELGTFFAGKYRGRGLARVDWNQDGLEDIAISHLDAPVALLTNTTTGAGNFLAISLRGRTSSRDALGSVVTVKSGDKTFVKQLVGGDGYQASNDRVLYFGLGSLGEVDSIEIEWPTGQKQVVGPQKALQSLLVIEGRPEPVVLWKKG